MGIDSLSVHLLYLLEHPICVSQSPPVSFFRCGSMVVPDTKVATSALVVSLVQPHFHQEAH
jgi:hypothetical protein